MTDSSQHGIQRVDQDGGEQEVCFTMEREIFIKRGWHAQTGMYGILFSNVWDHFKDCISCVFQVISVNRQSQTDTATCTSSAEQNAVSEDSQTVHVLAMKLRVEFMSNMNISLATQHVKKVSVN